MEVQHLTNNFMKVLLGKIGDTAEITLGQVRGKLALEFILPVHGYDMEYEFRVLAYKIGMEKYPPTQVIFRYDFAKVREIGKNTDYADILANKVVKALSTLVHSAGELHLITAGRPYNAYMKRIIL